MLGKNFNNILFKWVRSVNTKASYTATQQQAKSLKHSYAHAGKWKDWRYTERNQTTNISLVPTHPPLISREDLHMHALQPVLKFEGTAFPQCGW